MPFRGRYESLPTYKTQRRLVERWAVEGDGRQTIIALTRRGERVFKKEFPRHVSYLKQRFDQLGARDRDQAVRLLQKIQQIFRQETSE